MTDQPLPEEPKAPPSLEELLGTPDPSEQARRVVGLAQQLQHALNATELSAALYLRPADGQIRVMAPMQQTIGDTIALLDVARSHLLERKVRQEVEASHKHD